MSDYNFYLTSSDSEEEQDVESEEENQAPPNKMSRNSFTVWTKLEIVQYARNLNKSAASEKFHVHRGSKDDAIHCFKPDGPWCPNGRTLLLNAMLDESNDENALTSGLEEIDIGQDLENGCESDFSVELLYFFKC